MALSGEQFPIASGDHAATIVEVGGGLRSYTVDGEDVTVPYAPDVLRPRTSGALLVPWPNRLRGGAYGIGGARQQLPINDPASGSAIHGLGRWTRWQLVEHTADTVRMALDIVPQSGWPFEIRVEAAWVVDARRGLSLTLSARNHGSAAAPFGAGFHPYLSTRGAALDEVTVQLSADERLLTDEQSIPVGREPVIGTDYDFVRGRQLGTLRLDDGFTGLHYADGRGSAEVRTPRGGARVWFDESWRYVQLFTCPDVADGVPGIAAEPMTCPADAFNSGAGLVTLDPGGTWSASCGVLPLPAA